MNQEFKQTHIYVKTHNVTGLKYLGMTTKSDVHYYRGSGLLWKRHIKKHGYDVTTEVIGTFTNRDLCTEFALKYSTDHDIVASSQWANLIPENGINGGNNKPQGGELNGMFGRRHSKETIEQMSKRRTGVRVRDDIKQHLSKVHLLRADENAWNQIIEHNPNFPFSSYKDFLYRIVVLHSEGLSCSKITKLLNIKSIDVVRTSLRRNNPDIVFDQSWTKIKDRHPNFIFSTYNEFSLYCKEQYNDGRFITRIAIELDLNESTIKRAVEFR